MILIFYICYALLGLPKAAKGDHARYTLGSMISIGLAGIKYEMFFYLVYVMIFVTWTYIHTL